MVGELHGVPPRGGVTGGSAGTGSGAVERGAQVVEQRRRRRTRRRPSRRGGSRAAGARRPRRGRRTSGRRCRRRRPRPTVTTAPPMPANQSARSAGRASSRRPLVRHEAPAGAGHVVEQRNAAPPGRPPGPGRTGRPARSSPARTTPAVTPGSGGGAWAAVGAPAAISASRLGGLGRVGHADDLAERHREVDDRPDVVAALDLVGVEQAGRRTPGQHQVELPRQVGGVAQARAHALAGEGRHLVGGVAGEQHVARAPPIGPPGLEPVDGVALERGVAGRDVPGREQLPRPVRVVELLDGLAGQPHELPPPPAGAPDTTVVGPARLADLDVDRVEGARGSRSTTSTISQS